ncbi:MAG TPA: M13 family metallopeptidase, partial [Myxococcota bacterium]|nr:M13 family metallopeptidase [Myxococcota bacterium]
SGAQRGSVTQKVGDFFASGMDTDAIERAGTEPLRPMLAQIAAVHDAQSLVACIGALHQLGADPLFAFGARPDDKNSTTVIAQLYQGGLGLPDREYYFAADKASLKEEYQAHVGAMLALVAVPDAPAAAEAVLALETELAAASLTKVERRDPQRTYNKLNLRQLMDGGEALPWDVFFRAIGLGDPGAVNVEHPPFMTRAGELVHRTALKTWKSYLTWRAVHAMAPFLSEAFVHENFRFYGKALGGAQALRPRYKRVLDHADAFIGEALGQLYVVQAFPPSAKQRAAQIVESLNHAMRTRILGLEWMSDATKEKALVKLDKFQVKIGYPDAWIDYSTLDVSRDAYATNILRAQRFAFLRELQRINQPVDRGRWEMTPQTVNAYYDPQLNEIVFPAAILQYPFFDADADDAFNYGAMGAVIGHEITHGYDDQGRQYDGDGNINDWWTDDDEAKFKVRAAKIISQFNHYSVFDHPVNGDLTQGENIADLGGLKVAFRALQETMAKSKAVPQRLDGFTPEQRFFLSWAQIWRNQVRPETALQRLATDPHAPGELRVNGPLSNLPEFYAAFGIRPGDNMHRVAEDRVNIW